MNIAIKGKLTSSLKLAKSYISKGDLRSVTAKQNIVASFMVRCCSITISLLLVPITINYVNAAQYGIWLTLSSIVGWFSFFDVGLTHGLRNKFATAKAMGDDSLAQVYISTTYAILAIIFFIVWICFLIVNQFIDWTSILNISQPMQSEVSALAVIVFTYFCLQFVLKIINTIIIANQQPAKASFIDLSGQIISLLIVLLLVKTTKGSLIYLGLTLCLSPIFVLLVANVLYFKKSLKRYKPEFSKIDFSKAKGLFNLGVVFFIIQVANIIQYESANIIISRHFGITQVTSYNIVYKYFNVLLMVFMIFINPFWSASTEAYLKNDIRWIVKAIKMYSILDVVLLTIGSIMLLCSNTVFSLWLGEGKPNIDFSLSIFGFLFFMVCIFGGKYISFLNGIGALRIQFYASIISPFIYILTAYILIKKFQMGVYSLFLSAIISTFNAYLLAPIQYYQIVYKKKKGFWLK